MPEGGINRVSLDEFEETQLPRVSKFQELENQFSLFGRSHNQRQDLRINTSN